MNNVRFQQEAVRLRKKGKTYSEILAAVPVAKSTLSTWLRDVGLAKEQKQRLTLKRLEAGRRGGLARKSQRIKISEEIKSKAKKEIGVLNRKELWLIGIALYWGEGAKEKEHKPGSSINLMNSDPRMIQIFLSWLKDCCGVTRDRIRFEIYVHESHIRRIQEIQNYWAQVTGFSPKDFSKVYYKRHNPKTMRKNVGNLYQGILRVKVTASSSLLRKITGWTEGIVADRAQSWGVV